MTASARSKFVFRTASPVREQSVQKCGSCPSESAGTNCRPYLQWVRLLSGHRNGNGTVQSLPNFWNPAKFSKNSNLCQF